MAVDPEIDALLQRLLAPKLGYVCKTWPGSLLRLVRRFAATDKTDERSVLCRMLANPSSERIDLLVSAATVPHTSFFRHSEQFDHITKLLPQFAARGRRPVRLWSAGCATGEEAYSLALCAEAAHVEVMILATDVSPERIRIARTGSYPRGRKTGLKDCDPKSGWTAPESVRRRIRFEVSSLVGPDPTLGAGPFDIILCRNVLVYFEREIAHAILGRLANFLRDEGIIVLAPTEVASSLPETLFRGQPVGFLYTRAPELPLLPGGAARAKSSVPAPARASTRPRLERAAEFLGSGQAEASEDELRELLARSPHDPLVWFLLAEALSARGERVQARVAFLRAAEYATSNVDGIDAATLARVARRRAERG